MEIKASSVYDQKAYKALIRYTMFRTKNPKKRIISYFSVYLILFLFSLYTAVIRDDYTLLLYISVIMVIVTLLLCYFYFLVPKIRYKASYKMSNLQNHYIFTQDNVRILSNSDKYSSETIIDYSILFKVMETNEYLFLFNQKNTAYIVDKSTIQGGSISELRELLTKALQTKYSICI